MPRKTRMYLPGIPAHIVQRGNNRSACFFSNDDYLIYKEFLSEGLKRYGGQLHAYCLMTNHVHLLITPCEKETISLVVQHVGRQYVQYINRTYHRSGTLWEGRHKGSLIEADAYLLRCYRYIELNPVKAGMVDDPGQYRWSSHRANALGEADSLVSAHPVYQALGVERASIYRELFKTAMLPRDAHEISHGIERNHPVGSDRFKGQIEETLGRKLGTGKRGRPAKGRNMADQ